MTTIDEHLMTGLRCLERLRPAWEARRLTRRRPHPDPASDRQGSPLHAFETPESEVDDLVWPPALETVLDRCGTLPPYSAILGVGEDSLPFLLDLTYPAPGSLLIAGDARSGKTRLLRSILASTVYLNTSEQVVFNLIAQDETEYAALGQLDHCLEVLPADISSLAEIEALIDELVATVEERRRLTPGEPAIILAIDDLAECVRLLGKQAFTHLYWLVKHGPRARVLTIATLPSHRSHKVDARLLAAFRTRLVGEIRNTEVLDYICGESSPPELQWESGVQFYLDYRQDWLKFWICEPADLAQEAAPGGMAAAD